MLKVLILEDNTDKLTNIASLLIESKLVDVASIASAANSLSARNLLKEQQFDLLILDLLVPEQLGQAPSPNAGRHLLEDLLENNGMHMPSRIIGVTGHEDLAGTFNADFEANGVLLIYYEQKSISWQAPILMQLKQLAALE